MRHVNAAAKNYQILLIDDDASVREITEARLANYGFRVLTAVNGLHAMQRLKGAAEKVDLIITDLMMPAQNGLDLISEIKSNPDFKHIPIIALTGNIEISILKSAKMKGARDVIIKPITFQTLLDRIQQVIII